MNNNNNSNIKIFLDSFTPILNTVTKSSTDVLMAGDLNIDLLKIGEREKFSEYLDLLLGSGLLPQISIPTRFSKKNATLLDHIFSRFQNDPTNQNSISGILFTKISDHLPTFMFHKTNTRKKHYHPKYILQQSKDENSIQKFSSALTNTDILGKIDTSDHACPDKNYNVIQNIIIDEMDRNLPVKRVRFNKYKHKDSPWITQGIINSIRFRDNLYKKLKSTPSENPLYETLDQNLHVYNTMLRKNIRKAKLDYYNSLFTKFKDDIKKTWDTIKSVMKKTKNKKNIPECLIIDGKEIKDKITIAKKNLMISLSM